MVNAASPDARTYPRDARHLTFVNLAQRLSLEQSAWITDGYVLLGDDKMQARRKAFLVETTDRVKADALSSFSRRLSLLRRITKKCMSELRALRALVKPHRVVTAQDRGLQGSRSPKPPQAQG